MTPCKALIIAGYFDHLKEQGILSGDHLAEATADELRRLSAIEQAATAMFNSNSRGDTEQSAKALAIALGLFNPDGTEPVTRDQVLAWLVESVKVWPTLTEFVTFDVPNTPGQWGWRKKIAEVTLFDGCSAEISKQDWQAAKNGTSTANLAGG